METILLVDDEAALRDLSRLALERFGYRVLTAESGEEALDLYRTRAVEIHLVLLDLNMPGMGGGRCLKELIALNPAVRVIIASGYSANGQARDELKKGARAFIGKPYELKEMLAAIRKVIDAPGPCRRIV